MSLVRRLENVWIHFMTLLFNEFWYYPQHEALLAQYIPGPLPRISDMLRNISFFFITGNGAIDGAKLYPPNVIELSGLNTKVLGTLGMELKTVMDTSKSGVISFSLGSHLKMSQFQKEDIQMFLSVFEKLDQTVFWKTDLDPSHWDVPKNVRMRDWFDQVSVLAHPNCVLFVTHGGISSMLEAIQHAVPVVGMPFFADQDINVANAVYFGYGLHILYKNLTHSSLLWAIETVLADSRYKENIGKTSKALNDKPMPSLDTAVYWIEYVVRHKGAHHLKPLTVEMPWHQIFLLDVIAVYLFAFVISLFLAVKLVVLLCAKIINRDAIKEKVT